MTTVTQTSRPSVNWIAVVTLVCVAVAWSFARLWLQPARVFTADDFIARDSAYQLHLNDQLLAGKRFYSEVFSPYGPASAFLNLLWVRLFGNTARAFMIGQALLASVCLAQAFFLIRRVLSPWWAVCLTIVAVLPWMPSPAGGFGAVLPSYGGFERVILLAIALSWRPVPGRTRLISLQLGLLLGCLTWIKFGSCFVAGAALFVTDAIDSIMNSPRPGWRKFVLNNALILAGFLIGQFALAGYAFITLPAAIARDFLWPSYMLESYAGYVGSDRFLQWHNLGYFVGAELPLIAGTIAVLVGIFRLIRTTKATDNLTIKTFPPFVFLFLFWCLGLTGYFAHVWLILSYAWLLMVASAGALALLQPRWRLIALCGWLPCLLVTVRGVVSTPPADRSPKTFLNGETLWLNPIWETRLSALERTLDERCGPGPRHDIAIMGSPTAGGLAHYVGYSTLTRHAWLMAGFVRKYDEPAVRRSLDQTCALILFLQKPIERPGSNPNNWGLGPVFSRSLAAEIEHKFGEEIKIDRDCWVFIRPR
ncbi:MAG TPA: hypothetical protein VJ719_03040 [Chthoniobacterales bacterium]|nr:hypothetical protein [Chthoniobacterales bacterium]